MAGAECGREGAAPGRRRVGEAQTGWWLTHAHSPHTPTQGPKGELELTYPDWSRLKR